MSREMLERILETEVMDTASEASDYDAMDHSHVNRVFVEDFLKFCPELLAGSGSESARSRAVRLLDVGTGTAQIPIELCSRCPGAHVTAIDLALHMLQLGLKNVHRAGLSSAIKLEHVDAKNLPWQNGAFGGVISNSIIHHIPEPLSSLKEMVRMLPSGGVLFVRDLARPQDQSTLQQLVDTYAGNANPHQKQMFADSLHAALTPREVGTLLESVGLPSAWVQMTSDRHWTIAGRLQ